jgi:hypothetical protein
VNANGNVRANLLFSNVATGTAPITVTSTTRVANLNVSHANVSDFEAVTTQTTGTFYPVFVNANTSANYALGSNTAFSFNAATGNLIATLLTGTITTAAQPNITSVGSLTTLTVTGNANVGNLGTAGLVVATGNVTGGNLTTGGLVSATGNVSGGNLTTGGVVSATGNVTGSNIITAGTVTASTIVSNVAIGTAPFTVTSNTQVANLNVATAGLATYATTANAVAGGNVVGQVGNALIAGTVYTNAQPNITSTGTLSSLTVSANVATGGIKTDNYYYANGVAISFAGSYSNSNVANYLPTFTGTVGATALTTGANTTAGTITGNWTLTSGSKLEASYSDLAEY